MIYLHKLFPFYDFKKKPIQFPKIQNQPNTSDCGLFAMANATSILLKLDPCMITYQTDSMRNHLLNMFNAKEIKQFPIISPKKSL